MNAQHKHGNVTSYQTNKDNIAENTSDPLPNHPSTLLCRTPLSPRRPLLHALNHLLLHHLLLNRKPLPLCLPLHLPHEALHKLQILARHRNRIIRLPPSWVAPDLDPASLNSLLQGSKIFGDFRLAERRGDENSVGLVRGVEWEVREELVHELSEEGGDAG